MDQSAPPRRAGADRPWRCWRPSRCASVIHGWDPPFAYRTGYTPPRDIVAARAVHQGRSRGHRGRPAAGPQPGPLRLRAGRRAAGAIAGRAAQHAGRADRRADAWTSSIPKIWNDFQPPPADGANAAQRQSSRRSSSASFARRSRRRRRLDRVEKALAEVFAPFEERGLLDKLNQDARTGQPGGNHRLSAGPSRGAADRPRQRRADRRRNGHPRQPSQAAGSLGRGRSAVRLALAAAETHADRATTS